MDAEIKEIINKLTALQEMINPLDEEYVYTINKLTALQEMINPLDEEYVYTIIEQSDLGLVLYDAEFGNRQYYLSIRQCGDDKRVGWTDTYSYVTGTLANNIPLLKELSSSKGISKLRRTIDLQRKENEK